MAAQTGFGQNSVKRNYKTFNDTNFNVGDIILGPEIMFSLGGCGIFEQSKDSVDIIGNFIRNHPTFRIEIGVHTDFRGDAESNVKLTDCRARAILDYLTNQLLLPIDNFAIKGYGESEPIVSDKEIKRAQSTHLHANGLHQKNRRVEIKILRI